MNLIFDIAHLAHVELRTPDPKETLGFFKDLLGLEETERSARLGLPARLRRAISSFVEGYQSSERGTRACRMARPDATGAAEAGRSNRGGRARERLDRGRPGTWPRLPV